MIFIIKRLRYFSIPFSRMIILKHEFEHVATRLHFIICAAF